jgi:hypothetical protein
MLVSLKDKTKHRKRKGNDMAYPKLTLASANIVFEGIGVEITKHELGYYQTEVRGVQIQKQKLVDLTHEILKIVASD